MKLRAFSLLVLLSISLGVAACGEKPVPAETVILTRQATPVIATVVATEQATAAPTPVATQPEVAPPPTQAEIATEPTATKTMPTATAIATEQEPTAAPTEVAQQPTATSTTKPGYFSRDQLIEDARQIADIIETAHPDPYIRGGGKIAFHRRLQRLLNAIPEDGMKRDEFVRLLRPFVAAVGDSHTDIWSDYQVNDYSPGGVPLRFDIVEQSLYVAGIPKGMDQDLIGATLVSVEGVPLAELVQRQERLRAENEYHALWGLANESLWYAPIMHDLLPEWQDTSQVTVDLQLPSGEIRAFSFDLPHKMASLHTPATRVTLPSTNAAGLVYDFCDTERRIAYLRVDHMTNYRERCELESNSAANCASIPSATETFKDLVIDMEAAGSETLIVDLRENGGGNSAMSEILIYFLFGKDTLLSVMAASFAEGGSDIRRLSSLYLASSGITLEQMNQGRAVPLRVGDYDFSLDFTDDIETFQALLPQVPAIYEDRVRGMPTFYADYEAATYAGYYTPSKIVVLVTPGTFSSGFTMLRHLYLAGATLVGTPSGQAGNCFGNAKSWRLNHTGIEGGVSSTYYVDFPNDPEMGRVLPMHYPLTYELLASYDFDPNAEFLYALELLPELGETAQTPIATEPEQEPTETAPQPTATTSTGTSHYGYSRDELIEDARQLAGILESTHPDPYIRGGGKIAFHRRLHQLLNAIPEEGMTRDEFVGVLSPFIAAVGDGHTEIWDGYRVSDSYPGGVPLGFGIVERLLYVSGVPDEEDSDLLGALLVSVEGVPVAELCERQERLRGTENPYHALQLLACLSLRYRPFMQDLLPEWENNSRVNVELQLPSGEIRELVFDLPVTMGSLHSPGSSVTLPSTDQSGFRYDFLDAEGKTAYLRVDHMLHYREAYEIWALAGSRPSTEERRAHIKSATETFRDLVVDMKETGTETLIVDLRDNEGGHSLMSDILLYFLYGKEDFVAVKTYTPTAGGGEIRRYSQLFFRSCANKSIEDYNEGRAVPLIEGDYCFDDDFTDDEEKVRNLFQESEIPAFLDRWINRSPTFYAEFQSGAYGGYYRPERILVLVNPGTYSSGFTMARHLYLAGATLVGTPPAQASNCFGENLMWLLGHTQVGGSVSDAYFNQFPDDPELGRILPVHYLLTYEKLASYNFDPNAEYLYALEYLSEHGASSGLSGKLDWEFVFEKRGIWQ